MPGCGKRKSQAISSGCQVINLDNWRRNASGRRPAISPLLYLREADFRMLSRAQKQAALLRCIVSDDIKDSDLDAMARAII